MKKYFFIAIFAFLFATCPVLADDETLNDDANGSLNEQTQTNNQQPDVPMASTEEKNLYDLAEKQYDDEAHALQPQETTSHLADSTPVAPPNTKW